jgi:hypothetical protein
VFSVLQAQQVEKLSVEDGVIQLEVILTEKLVGLYTVNCSSNTVGPIASGNQVTLLVVDSKELCVTEYRPNNVNVGTEFQVSVLLLNLFSTGLKRLHSQYSGR